MLVLLLWRNKGYIYIVQQIHLPHDYNCSRESWN